MPISDNCPNPVFTQTSGLASGSLFPIGTTTNSYEITDASGLTSTCTFDVTVNDTEAPSISCPGNITVGNDPGDCGAVVTFDVPVSDNCPGEVLAQTNGLASGSIFPIGTTTNTFEVTDASGLTTMCTFDVIVTDTQAPIVNCTDITIQLDASGMATITPNDIGGTSTDNCGIASETLNIDTFNCNNVGLINNVILTVTDDSGNSTSCVATVTVEDTIPITVLCQDITATLDNNGEVTIEPEDVDAGSFDNCDITSMSLSQDTFTCADVGPNEVTLTVTNSNDETATCTAIVTVQETILPPMAICQNVTAPLGENGMVTVLPEAINNNSLGIGCNGTLSLDLDTFTCEDVGPPIPVILTVMNENGVIDTCQAFIHVVDSLDPTITCPEDQYIPATDSYTLPDYFATGDAVGVDNCNLTLSQTPPPGTVLLPGSYNIIMGVTDPSNNEEICVFQLHIEGILGVDNTPDIGSVLVYPNPASTYFAVANPQGISLNDVSIYDVGGRLIKKVDLSNMGVDQHIDISELASATYMVLITSEEGQLVKQLIKQ